MKKHLFSLAEWIGTSLVIGAYLLLLLEILPSESIIYLLMNLIGGSLVGIVVWIKKVYGPFTIQLFWCIISLFGIVKYFHFL